MVTYYWAHILTGEEVGHRYYNGKTEVNRGETEGIRVVPKANDKWQQQRQG